ncbi:MAG: hypothetical protein GY712_08735 [Oceanicoccus sp.]|uniref:hypothetical protein n=1 Tax=Oceanicoccus sp. TaxID=2691044 RepID=UPI00262D56B6|nr:hypothetical protein [Oceanicoccus sp.]MCP3908087.1 hypothetical protein [Oceanicoccus sp.]
MLQPLEKTPIAVIGVDKHYHIVMQCRELAEMYKGVNMLKKLLTVLALTMGISLNAFAAFTGDYDFGYWTNWGHGLTVPDDVDVPGSLQLFGDHTIEFSSPDCGEGEGEGGCSGPAYVWPFTVAATSDGYVSFDWTFDTADDGPWWDTLVVFIDGNPFGVVDPSGSNSQSGSAGFNVNNLDVFGFGLWSEDSCCGASQSTVTNFVFNPSGSGSDGPFYPLGEVPLPGAVWFLGSGLLGLVGFRRKISSNRSNPTTVD